MNLSTSAGWRRIMIDDYVNLAFDDDIIIITLVEG